jgi:subtilisin family serine protease
MDASPSFTDTYEVPAADELVAFSVICRPRPDITVESYRELVARSALREVLPPKDVQERVAADLRKHGFEVFDLRGSVVFARGTVGRFEAVFGGRLQRLVRTYYAEFNRRSTAVVVDPREDLPSPERIEGALLVTLAEPPLLAGRRLPPGDARFCLRLPGDVAQITGASATHRCRTPTGAAATGINVVVAVVDTGFACHPYFEDHGYRISREAAPDAQQPEQDDEWHGTFVLAHLLACAPDVEAHAIKYGRVDLAFAAALSVPNIRVISLSWAYRIPASGVVEDYVLSLQVLVMEAVAAGVVVVVGAGNYSTESIPATMPDVIAVGGAHVAGTDDISVWSGSTSFKSTFFRGRSVPDLCGLSSLMMLPVPESPTGTPFGWHVGEGATSCATPQVAGVAALLIQKNPALSPQDVRDALVDHASDIYAGTSASGDQAVMGPDDATGGGLVNALDSWNNV